MKKFSIALIFGIAGLVFLGMSFIPSSSSGELDVDIVKTKNIMPAAHHVYANPEALNGKYYLFKSKLTNTSSSLMEDVKVSYRIPGFIEWTELSMIGEMLPGQSAVVSCYPKFPDNISEKMTESTEKVEIEITWDGASDDDMIEEDFAFRISDRNEYSFTNIEPEEIVGWGDVYNNDNLLACYVTPNDPIVKYYTQNIQEKILKGEQASVTKDPKEAVRFLRGIYDATVLSHMVYSGTKGIPESIRDVSKFSQHNRLPREVITGNTGLCLELSLLYASILSSAGIDPIIYLVPGHAYPGFKLNNQYFAIEPTKIGGEGLGSIGTSEEAFLTGQKELEEFIKKAQMGDPRYTIVDVHAVNQMGATPMVLKDDDFLRKKVDEIVASWGTSIPQTSYTTDYPKVNPNDRVDNRPIPNPTPQPQPSSTSGLSFSIPNGWQTMMKPMPEVPIITAQVISPDQTTTVTIYDIPAQSNQQAMSILNEYFSMYGMLLDYQISGNSVSGTTVSYDQTFIWKGKTINTGSGIRFVAVGSPDYLYNQNTAIINQVYNSIR